MKNIKIEKIDGYYGLDKEAVEGRKHYKFFYKTENCLFVNKELIITICKGIKIADPEQILFYKKKYIEVSDKHKRDFQNINKLRYSLENL